MAEHIYSPTELARRMGAAKNAVRRWIETGALRVQRVSFLGLWEHYRVTDRELDFDFWQRARENTHEADG